MLKKLLEVTNVNFLGVNTLQNPDILNISKNKIREKLLVDPDKTGEQKRLGKAQTYNKQHCK